MHAYYVAVGVLYPHSSYRLIKLDGMKLVLGFDIICCLLTTANCCVQEYNELEDWIIRNVANLDNLTAGFFPANLQPSLIVEIFFHVNGTPWDYETYLPRPASIGCANFTQLPSTSCRYSNNIQ